MTIDPNDVTRLYDRCTSNDGTEVASVFKHRLDTAELAKHRTDVEKMLGEMDDAFMVDGGGGMSFLNLCQDRDGHLWTGLHQTCDQLLAMGVGLGLVSFPFPREVWDALPGAVPYVQINRPAFAA